MRDISGLRCVRTAPRTIPEADMDQGVELKRTDRIRAIERLRDFIVRSVDGARAAEAPFYHLQLENVFPDDFYASMLTAMPEG